MWLCNTLASFKRYVIEPKVFLGYPTRGITCALNIPRHEQYPSNNLAHGVYQIPQTRYCFLFKFWYGYATSLQILKYMLWSPLYLWDTLQGVLQVYE